jgi:hypothetical protein
MVWGNVIYKSGDKLEIDDYEVIGAAVRVVTAHSHKEKVIPLSDIVEIAQGKPNGMEEKLKRRARGA